MWQQSLHQHSGSHHVVTAEVVTVHHSDCWNKSFAVYKVIVFRLLMPVWNLCQTSLNCLLCRNPDTVGLILLAKLCSKNLLKVTKITGRLHFAFTSYMLSRTFSKCSRIKLMRENSMQNKYVSKIWMLISTAEYNMWQSCIIYFTKLLHTCSSSVWIMN